MRDYCTHIDSGTSRISHTYCYNYRIFKPWPNKNLADLNPHYPAPVASNSLFLAAPVTNSSLSLAMPAAPVTTSSLSLSTPASASSLLPPINASTTTGVNPFLASFLALIS